MINSRSDYVVAEPPHGITIDGGIMPARDVANDGSWKILRGEDPSFLMEAGLRIKAYRNFSDTYPYSGSFPYPVDIRLNKSDLQRAITLIHDGATSGYTWPEVPMFKSPTDRGTSGGTPWRYYAGAISSDTTLGRALVDAVLTSATQSQSTTWRYSSWSHGGYGDKLQADRIRDMYYDLNRVKGVMTNGTIPMSKSGEYRTTRMVHWHPVYDYDEYHREIGLADAVEDADSWEQNDYGCYCLWYRGASVSWLSYDTNYNFTIGFSNKRIPAGLSPYCTVLIPIVTTHLTWRTIYTFPSPGNVQTETIDSPQETYYDVLAADVAFSATGEASFSISSSLVIDLAAGSRNLPTQWSDLAFGKVGNAVLGEALSIQGNYATAFFYDSGFDFSSLNWVYPT